jgi:pyruvate kinase
MTGLKSEMLGCGLKSLIAELAVLRAQLLENETSQALWITGANASYRASARNLAHYLALRQRDLRPLQQSLDHLGVSSLGRAESNVIANVDKVIAILSRLDGKVRHSRKDSGLTGIRKSRDLLERHTTALLGPSREERSVRIMVTLPSEAASDFGLIRQLVEGGMDIARINCAHDGEARWLSMAANVRRAAKTLGRPVRILMDLGGPKLRTGPMKPRSAVLKLRPQRDRFGIVLANALVGLRPTGAATLIEGCDVQLGVNSDFLASLEKGDHLDFTDASNSKRSLQFVQRTDGGVIAQCCQTAHLVPQTRLRRRRKGRGQRVSVLSDVPCGEGFLHLSRGSRFRLTDGGMGDVAADNLTLPTISCTLPQVFEQVQVGERIWFDDGRIGGVITHTDPKWLEVEVTHARDGGEKLRGDKGINIPDSQLDLPALTDKDIGDLAVVATVADIVGLSFVQRSSDIDTLRSHLKALDAPDLGIILKIETRRSFENLPELLFSAMSGKAAGVMIARGDLAVECGYERLAEVQEEILWAAEAAHMPVIWATQVLETLAKTGLPTRAEITDAAMGERAECVMLNKGPHIAQAMYTLNDILHRMQGHQDKKHPLLRALHAWTSPPATTAPT